MTEVSKAQAAHETLITAREYLVTYGWRRGAGGGAIYPQLEPGVIGQPTDPQPTCLGLSLYSGGRGFRTAIALLGFDTLTDLYQWNDAQESIEPILARLDEAIAKTSPLAEAVREDVRRYEDDLRELALV